MLIPVSEMVSVRKYKDDDLWQRVYITPITPTPQNKHTCYMALYWL